METILDIEKDALGAATIGAALAGEIRVIHCPDPRTALAAARERSAAAILLDLETPGAGFDFLRDLARILCGPPVIVHSEKMDVTSAVRAVRLGAADYLVKPCPLDTLAIALRRALRPRRAGAAPFDGGSPGILRAAELVGRFASSAYPVLVLGESGTGKELAARAVHDLSPRRSEPFVAQNCAALPEMLAECELFGSVRGAFTGAVDRPGAFELAGSGTLFLDEIGETPLSVQAKLLRVLESGEFRRLGGTSPLRSNARLVTATSRNLKTEADAGRFRADLLYRIETLTVSIPPLRERRCDIPTIAVAILEAAAPGRKSLSLSALERLSIGDWPGNARELRNTIQRAVVLSGDREEIHAEDLEL